MKRYFAYDYIFFKAPFFARAKGSDLIDPVLLNQIAFVQDFDKDVKTT